MDKILNMILRQITRSWVSRGINAGLSTAASLGCGEPGQPCLAENKAQSHSSKMADRQVRQVAKMMSHSTRI